MFTVHTVTFVDKNDVALLFYKLFITLVSEYMAYIYILSACEVPLYFIEIVIVILFNIIYGKCTRMCNSIITCSTELV